MLRNHQRHGVSKHIRMASEKAKRRGKAYGISGISPGAGIRLAWHKRDSVAANKRRAAL